MTCPHHGKYQVPWVSPPAFLPTLHQASSMREYLFITGQPVPAINRRLEIPPDVIPGEKKKKAIPSLSPALSYQVCIIFCRVVLSPPALRLVCKQTAERSAAAVGLVGTRERGAGSAPRSQGQATAWEVAAVGFPSQRNPLAVWGQCGFF